MPGKVFAVGVVGPVAEPPLPPLMFRRCQQTTNKGMEDAGVDEDVSAATAHNSITPQAVCPRPPAWAVCFPRHTRCPHPQEVEAIYTTLPLTEDTTLKVACRSRCGPRSPALLNCSRIGTHVTRADSTFLTGTPAQLARPNANWATTLTSRDKMRSSILTQAGIAALNSATRINSQPCDG